MQQYFFRESEFLKNNNTISDKEGQKVDENFEITPKSTYEENETSTATVKFAKKSAKSAAASNLIFFVKSTEPEINNSESVVVHPFYHTRQENDVES